MKYDKTQRYDWKLIREKIMGPNPLKLMEEQLMDCPLPKGSIVMDLGCGQGITSVFLAREYGFTVYATDLWSKPEEHLRFFNEMGLDSHQIVPIHADASNLPYAPGFFDGIISTDSYHYFGGKPGFLEERILPYLKSGGYFYAVVPGMVKDRHDHLPAELLLSWTKEDLDTIHDADYWKGIIGRPQGAEMVSIRPLETNEEAWADWLRCENPYAVGDRKSMDAGAGKYMNFVSIVIQKR